MVLRPQLPARSKTMKTNNLKTFTITLELQVQARDDEEALEIGHSISVALREGTVSDYRVESVVFDRVEED